VSHCGAARKHRAGATNAVLVCLKSAEPFYEPSELTPARSSNQCGFERSASDAGRTLRYAGGSAPARRPTQNNLPLTLLNWRKTDVSILRGHTSAELERHAFRFPLCISNGPRSTFRHVTALALDQPLPFAAHSVVITLPIHRPS